MRAEVQAGMRGGGFGRSVTGHPRGWKRSPAAGACLALLVLAAFVTAGCSTRIGRILSALTGAGIGGARVSFSDQTGRVSEVVTAADGTFRVDNLPIALLTASVQAGGYIPQTRRADQDAINATWTLATDPAPGNDADGDGLSAAAEAAFATSPTDRDTDHDGIDDRREALVVAPLGLAGMGADPRRKDIFIEIDHDANNPGTGDTTVTQSMVDRMSAVYRASPLTNPDGSTGVTPHIDNGQLGGGSAVTGVPPGWGCFNFAGYDGAQDLAPERRDVFFHVLSGDLSSCGLYGFAYDARRVVVDVGQPQLAGLQDLVGAGTILHELGHTLGLMHGGFEENRCKPNYPSVMNYDPVPVFLTGLDYSRGLQPDVSETAIDETRPLYSWPQYDWNHDGTIQATAYPMDVDNFSWLDPAVQSIMNAVFSPARCPPNGINPAPLRDNDDWATIGTNLATEVGVPMVVVGGPPAGAGNPGATRPAGIVVRGP